MNFHELVGRRVLALDRRHVRVANPSQFSVRRFDLLTRGDGWYAEDFVQRGHGSRAEIRWRLGLSRSVSGAGGEGANRLKSYTCRRFRTGCGGENRSGEECGGG